MFCKIKFKKRTPGTSKKKSETSKAPTLQNLKKKNDEVGLFWAGFLLRAALTRPPSTQRLPAESHMARQDSSDAATKKPSSQRQE